MSIKEKMNNSKDSTWLSDNLTSSEFTEMLDSTSLRRRVYFMHVSSKSCCQAFQFHKIFFQRKSHRLTRLVIALSGGGFLSIS